jgi:hypothetical protein
MLLHPVFNISGLTPPFPYTFPLKSVRANGVGATAADWTQITGNMIPETVGQPSWVLEGGGTFDRAEVYQSFSIGSTRETVVDAGNALIDLSHSIDTFDTDDDGAVAYAEFFDGSSNFLGRVHTNNSQTDTRITDSKNNARVPTGTRTIRIGWLGSNPATEGNQLSAYVYDLNCIIKEEESDTWDSTVVLFAEAVANLTGWTNTTGTLGVVTYANGNDWEWQTANAYFGSSVATTTAFKNFTFPTGWPAKVSAGDANYLFRASVHNANQDDDVTITLRFNNGSTNPTVTSGRVEIAWQIQLIELTGAIPSDTTSIDVILTFHRVDGTVNDGAVEKMSMILFEQA